MAQPVYRPLCCAVPSVPTTQAASGYSFRSAGLLVPTRAAALGTPRLGRSPDLGDSENRPYSTQPICPLHR